MGKNNNNNKINTKAQKQKQNKKQQKQKRRRESSLMCFVGDKVSRAGICKGFSYRIPKTLKEAHNLIFLFFSFLFKN